MLNDKLDLYHQKKNEAVALFGLNASKVADFIIGDCFPETVEAAEREGCIFMLRRGLIQQLTNEFKRADPIEARQLELDFPPAVRDIVPRLKGTHHYVESLGEWVDIRELCQNLAWLDDARKYKRAKGEQVLAEATVLDEIYAALAEAGTQ